MNLGEFWAGGGGGIRRSQRTASAQPARNKRALGHNIKPFQWVNQPVVDFLLRNLQPAEF